MEEQNLQASDLENQSNSNQEGKTPSLFAAALQREHPEWVTNVSEAFGETTIIVPREHIVAACTFLKREPGLEFNFLADVCGFDRGPEEEPRFEVNYHLFSTTKFHRVRLKIVLNDDDAHVQTVTGIWRTANWHERETYDLFGVVFDEHPDLRPCASLASTHLGNDMAQSFVPDPGWPAGGPVPEPVQSLRR